MADAHPHRDRTDDTIEATHVAHINEQIGKFRKQLLGMTMRNNLLSCPHGLHVRAQIRIVDELPDAVFQHLEAGDGYTFLPLPEPRETPDDEDSEEFVEALRKHKEESVTYRAASTQLRSARESAADLSRLERETRNNVRLHLGMGIWQPEHGLDAGALARCHGIVPSYDLPLSQQEQDADRHHDDVLQTLLKEADLSPRLRLLRDRARSSVRQMGVGTMFAAFGFLEWYESDVSDTAHYAPLILVPVELDRRLDRGRYRYTLRASEEGTTENVTLAVYVRQHFDLELPLLGEDDSVESYFAKVEEICQHRRRWRVRRFLTLGIFAYSKLAIYKDLDPEFWPDGHEFARHSNIRTLMAQAGVADIPYAEDREIDEDKATAATPVLIYDADSSQHSAIADVLEGNNLTIYGPPGTGKSQTITNIIAAAMMAGKTVLFVAEKLTALDVVRDRLEKAGLDPFCFNLHAQGLRSSAVRASLEKRLNLPRPSFSQARYEQQRENWTTQRDALRTYARIMGETVGRLDETVHDILWQTIRRRNVESDLPRAGGATSLADVEGLTSRQVDEARTGIRQLVDAASSVDVDALGTRPPWRGVRRSDLSPVELGSILHLVESWQESVARLERMAVEYGFAIDTGTIAALKQMVAALEVLSRHPGTLAHCKASVLAEPEARDAVVATVERARRASDVAEELRDRHGMQSEAMPEAPALRSLVEDAAEDLIQQMSPEALWAEARSLRERADERERAEAALGRLRRSFGVTDPTVDADDAIVRGVELLRATDRSLLSSRSGKLVTREAKAVHDRALRKVSELRRVQDDLAQRFALALLPSSQELREAISALSAVRGPIFLNGPARRAMHLHRTLALERGKASADAVVADLRRLAEFMDDCANLQGDKEFADTLVGNWRGLESDLTYAGQVVDWATNIMDQFAGTSGGRQEVRSTLLHGNVDLLDEIRLIAADLALLPDRGSDPGGTTALRDRAERMDALANQAQQLALDPGVPIERATDATRLIETYRSLTARTASDEFVSLVLPDTAPTPAMLEATAVLCTEMSAQELPQGIWATALELSQRPGSILPLNQELIDALASEETTWVACVDGLKLHESEFFDGHWRPQVPFPALRGRTDECLRSRSELLLWSTYQRARVALLRSHAASVLKTIEELGVPVSRLADAYEWALYRSLATAVYRQHPELNSLTGWQLQHHRVAFQDLEARLQDLERARIAHELYSRTVEHGESFGKPGTYTEKALIQYQLTLQRSSVTPRDLLRRSGKALRQLKPCFMMSPTTVAELLPRDAELFDITIIDEASQMLPCDALGAIARGKQSVIVGDPKQLPPSTFFQGAGVLGNDDGDDDALAAITESILDLGLSAWRPPRHLRWHYRSRDSSLIQFSNARFYDDQLIVFPGPNEQSEKYGVHFHHVAVGLYKGSRNPGEAEQVVRAACEFMEDPKNRELNMAIVAMNQPQRDLIDEMMDHESAHRPAVARYRRRWEDTLYPFMVRNLETVQGDERDIIFISTVYGRESPGANVMRRFGPITHAGGERRLNVLFTRARWRIDVFSSMQANDITAGPGTSEGVQVLRDYLEYAATRRIGAGVSTAVETESPFEEHVRERLLSQGFGVEPQIGVVGYRIDLGIKHPEYPHGFLLGIECDGATYHSARSVRDRDRLREAVLRDLGWDIYRIWSTDWFNDPDGELRKLLDYVERRIDRWRSGTTPESEQTSLIGEVVEEAAVAASPTRPDDFFSETASPTDEEVAPYSPQDENQDFVEVGDTVLYRRADQEVAETRQVTIVRGVDNPGRGVINDDKPLAVALLGAAVGEHVTVRQPTSETEIVVVRIARPDRGPEDEPPRPGTSREDGVELGVYREWYGKAADPRSASISAVADTLCQIVETEGPVLESRAYRAYIRASEVLRLGPHVRRALNRALASLARNKRIVVEQRSDRSGYVGALLRTPQQDRVSLREIGPRSFDEVPLFELAELIDRVRSTQSTTSTDEVYRTVLSHYGLVRMTRAVRERLDDADAIVA